MERRNLGNMGLGSAIVAALLLPGGILLLAWVLYRRYWSWLAGRWVSLAALIALLQGCATQLAVKPESGPAGAEAAPAQQALRFQSHDVAPRDGNAPLIAEDLRPGDIILSSGPGLVSTGVQLVTLAPVSHVALYVGDRRVVEAVRPEVQVRQLDDVLAEGTVALVLRHPDLSSEQAASVSRYALQKTGTGFNFLGVTLHVPSALGRRVCELPLVPSAVRDACIRSVGLIHYVAPAKHRLFCSQLVLEAYRQAGAPLTDADPRLITPSDILHMREGDVSSIRIHKPLRYVGHLKYAPPAIVALGQ